MKQKVLKPGQLFTYKNHVYRVKKVKVEAVCDHCELKECKNMYITFPSCRWNYGGKYLIPYNCELTLVK
jgi:hypothetical protein